MKSIKLVSAALQKCKSGLPAFGKTAEQPRIIVHIPHSSTNIRIAVHDRLVHG